MKKLLLISLSLLVSLWSFSQTQQGIVKTRGRMVDGEVVPGTRLAGATITLNFGNPLVSSDQGTFSFNVPATKSYSLVSAKKQGYTLADPEYTRRSFSYSADNPFYVVLEDENQRQADINAATRKVRRTLMAQLDEREEEIESLKAQNKLTEKEYQDRLKQLYDNQSKSEQLVRKMAERYASTDYDQLDEFNRQVQMYIEEGELQKADSLIRSEGDIEKRVAEYHEVVAANNAEREKLEQSEKGAAKTYEDLSQDLFSRSEIFLQKFQQDSALYCLKLRADLDTANVDAVWKYVDLCYFQKKFEDCERYWQICLNLFIRNNDLPNIAVTQNNLGGLYHDLHDYQNSEKYHKSALENWEQLFNQNPDAYRASLAGTQNNLGILYRDLHKYQSSEKYFQSALENYEQLFNQNPDAYRADLAGTQNNLGILYIDLHKYQSSEKYYQSALENREQLFNQNPDAYRADLAMTQNNLGNLYSDLCDYQNSEKYYQSALENREQLFNQNPDAYRASLAGTQNNLGILYRDLHKYQSSEKYHKSALENYEYLFKLNPDLYRDRYASTLFFLGSCYLNESYEEAGKWYRLAAEQGHVGAQFSLGVHYWSGEGVEQSYEEAVKWFFMAAENGDQDAQYLLGNCYYNGDGIVQSYDEAMKWYRKAAEQGNVYAQYMLGSMYYTNKDYSNGEKYLKLALTYFEDAYKYNQEEYLGYLTSILNLLACLYASENRFTYAYHMIDRALALMPLEANFYDTKGEIFLLQGNTQESLEMWKRVLELDPDFLDKYPGGTNLSNGLRELGLIEQ